MLCSSRVLDLNADCCEFCPVENLEEILAVGTYQLEESSQNRIGKLYVYSDQDEELLDGGSLSLPGIFDMKWLPVETGRNKASLGVAAADGSLRMIGVTNHGNSKYVLEEEVSCEELVESGMLLFVDFNKSMKAGSMPEMVAVSSSSGDIGLGKLGDEGIVPLATWRAHDLEAWCVAFDHWQVDILYSGADDCKFKGWDSREGCERPALFCNQKEHGAGVCCIASNPHKQHHVISGSYDEYARYWDIRNLSKPLLQCKISCGGGVWRLKFHPRKQDCLVAACMHDGFKVLQLTEEHQELKVVEEYRGHGSLAYGGDWSWAPSEAASKLATCSFYDNLLHLWTPSSQSRQ